MFDVRNPSRRATASRGPEREHLDAVELVLDDVERPAVELEPVAEPHVHAVAKADLGRLARRGIDPEQLTR